MWNNYTTLEQSRQLIEAGLDPNTADLLAFKIYSKKRGRFTWKLDLLPYSAAIAIRKHSHSVAYDREETPIWSLEALMELLPPSIKQYSESERCYRDYGLNLFRSYYHCCGYSFGPSLSQENHDTLCCFGCDSWIESVVMTVKWALENGHIKKTK